MEKLTAPFPYPGGKRNIARLVNDRIGKVDVYIEPFLGSAAILLSREPSKREVVCDLSGIVSNFWRSIKNDPEQTASYADWPTVHDDLTARHRWIAKWAEENVEKIRNDPDWFDAKAAGWWAWGQSNWIGEVYGERADWDKQPGLGDSIGGRGIQIEATKNIETPDKRPIIGSAHSLSNVIGIQTGRKSVEGDHEPVSGDRLRTWFAKLAKRLEKVVVLSRGWEHAVTPAVMADGNASSWGVFLDPPYVLDTGRAKLYAGDTNANEVARASAAWAVAHGEKYRIAYCGYPGLHDFSNGWEVVERQMPSVRRQEAIWFSPACQEQPKQERLL